MSSDPSSILGTSTNEMSFVVFHGAHFVCTEKVSENREEGVQWTPDGSRHLHDERSHANACIRSG